MGLEGIWGDLLILRGERGGGISRSQQSVKGGIWKLYCQLTAKRGAGGGGGAKVYFRALQEVKKDVFVTRPKSSDPFPTFAKIMTWFKMFNH